ncbi:hypothetical protein L227DRAFT_332877 [Lentinus tigrinus ALCF2SS1-6]|uniref:Uncharacterized protein n=1 Tax=Lentinus tigrinus ALCF2SS1-6 TaxID=1328759 RepID=A0A5C2RW35_9APHY|nr:hypothetical protein L227DRAFT_332877 [Lentinus tigrinus ALCF2SS1-6]
MNGRRPSTAGQRSLLIRCNAASKRRWPWNPGALLAVRPTPHRDTPGPGAVTLAFFQFNAPGERGVDGRSETTRGLMRSTNELRMPVRRGPCAHSADATSNLHEGARMANVRWPACSAYSTYQRSCGARDVRLCDDDPGDALRVPRIAGWLGPLVNRDPRYQIGLERVYQFDHWVVVRVKPTQDVWAPGSGGKQVSPRHLVW